MRTSEHEEQCVTPNEIHRIAIKLGLPYAETSALTQQGVKDCFDTAVRQLLTYYAGG